MRVASKNPISHAWLALIAFITVPLSKMLVIPAIVLDACQIWMHEFGHALIAWFSGRAATPLGIGWTNISEEPSWIVRLCFLFLLGVIARKALLHRSWFLMTSVAFLFWGTIHYSFLVNTVQTQISITWCGMGGQMIIGAWFVIAYFFEFPPGIRWDFLKYPALFMGAYSLTDTYWLWHQISRHKASIPFGSMIHGEEDSGGDMNQMLDGWGWLKNELISSYTRTGMLCLTLVSIVIAIFLIKDILIISSKK